MVKQSTLVERDKYVRWNLRVEARSSANGIKCAVEILFLLKPAKQPLARTLGIIANTDNTHCIVYVSTAITMLYICIVHAFFLPHARAQSKIPLWAIKWENYCCVQSVNEEYNEAKKIDFFCSSLFLYSSNFYIQFTFKMCALCSYSYVEWKYG